GPNNGAACTLATQCRRCVGGSNAGASCTLASQCPGGTCPPASSTPPGEPTKPNACSDANCDTPQTGNDFEGSAGPFDQFCEPSAACKSCTAAADCLGLNSCNGGSNAGADCSVASQCPGGSCDQDLCTG